MAAPDPDDEWVDLCEEFRAAQDKESEAIERAFSQGRIASGDAMLDVEKARKAVDAIRRRMDAFMDRQKKR